MMVSLALSSQCHCGGWAEWKPEWLDAGAVGAEQVALARFDGQLFIPLRIACSRR